MEWTLIGLITFLGLISGEPNQAMNTIYKTALSGGQQVLPCEVLYPPNQDDLEFVVTWKKGSLGLHRVLLTKVDGYSPTIEKDYQDRLQIVNKTSLQISHIEPKDHDWYECSILFTNGKKETPMKTSFIHLTVHTPPQITRSSGTLLNVQKGDPVKLFCEGKGAPDPNITWTKDGVLLNTTARTTVNRNEVHISNVQREDGGTYTCTFSNNAGDRSQPMKLVIEGGPYIMTLPGNQTALEGQRVVFPCGTEGYPSNIVHTWYRDLTDIRTTDGFKAGRMMIRSDGSLVIKTAVKTDRGWFTCRPSNRLGQDEASAFLNVLYKPVVLSMPSQLFWAKGYRQQIECPVDSNPAILSTTWVRDKEQILSEGRFDILNNGTLVVNDVALSDAGSYSCTPENAMGQGLSSNRVQILVRDPPQITVSPQLLYIKKAGDTVVMNCEATGIPSVAIQWIKVKGEQMDRNSGRIAVTSRYLEIKNLTKEDTGKYECRAINSIASVSTITDLRVDSTTPHAPLNVTAVAGLFNVTVTWEPAYDGGSPQFYILWMKKTTKTDWIAYPVPGQTVTYFRLDNLQPDTEYDFKVLPRNSFGNGSFSEVVRERTLGYSPDAVSALPTDKDGIQYHPEIHDNRGLQPSAPWNVTAYARGRDIFIKWRIPPNSPVPIFSYRIEYQHDGKWNVHHRRIAGNMSNSVVLSNMHSGTYNICVRAFGVLAYSPLSNPVRVRVMDGASKSTDNVDASTSTDGMVITQALIGGIIGGVLFLLVAILLALVAVFYSRRKERKAKEKTYNGVNYGKPNDINDRYHELAAQRNSWQHDGGGNFVTHVDNSDIFFLPQASSNNNPVSAMRPLILLTRPDDRRHLCGADVACGKECGQDQQVPLTNQSNFSSCKYEPVLFRLKPNHNRMTNKNRSWPNEENKTRFQRQLLSKSLPPSFDHFPRSYVPQMPLRCLSHSVNVSPLSKSHSFPSHHQSTTRPSASPPSQHYPHVSASSSFPSYFGESNPRFSTFNSEHHLQDPNYNPSDNVQQHMNQRCQNYETQDGKTIERAVHLLDHPQTTYFSRNRCSSPFQAKNITSNQNTALGSRNVQSEDESSFKQKSKAQCNSPQCNSPQCNSSPIIYPSKHFFYLPKNKSSRHRPEYCSSKSGRTQHFNRAIFNRKYFHSPQNTNNFNISTTSSNQPDDHFTANHLRSVSEAMSQRSPSMFSPKPRHSKSNSQRKLVLADIHQQGVSNPQRSLKTKKKNSDNILHLKQYEKRLQGKNSRHISNISPVVCSPANPSRSCHKIEGKDVIINPKHFYRGQYDATYNLPVSGRSQYGSVSYPDVSIPQHKYSPIESDQCFSQLPCNKTRNYYPRSLSYDPNMYLYDQSQHLHHQQMLCSDRIITEAPYHIESCDPHPRKYDSQAVNFDPHLKNFDSYPRNFKSHIKNFNSHPKKFDPFLKHFDSHSTNSDHQSSKTLNLNLRNSDQRPQKISDVAKNHLKNVTFASNSGSRYAGSLKAAQVSRSCHQTCHQKDMSKVVLSSNTNVDCDRIKSSHQSVMLHSEPFDIDSLNDFTCDKESDFKNLSTYNQRWLDWKGSNHGSVHKDILHTTPGKLDLYPNFEERFRKLREEFKQHKKQKQSTVGRSNHPVYPMDSEML